MVWQSKRKFRTRKSNEGQQRGNRSEEEEQEKEKIHSGYRLPNAGPAALRTAHFGRVCLGDDHKHSLTGAGRLIRLV